MPRPVLPQTPPVSNHPFCEETSPIVQPKPPPAQLKTMSYVSNAPCTHTFSHLFFFQDTWCQNAADTETWSLRAKMSAAAGVPRTKGDYGLELFACNLLHFQPEKVKKRTVKV